MKLIAHRGNIQGKNPERENSIEYITKALRHGYDVEIDVWYVDGEWILSHEDPKNEYAKPFHHKVNFDFLKQSKLWLHCKNIQAMINLCSSDTNYFWHENDKYTITSKGHIWCFPNQPAPTITVEKTVDDLYKNDMSFFRQATNRLTVGVLPEVNKTDIYQYDAICTDSITMYENELKKNYDKTGTI